MKYQTPTWRYCVNLLGQRAEANRAPFQFFHRFGELTHGAGKPVELPDDQGIALAQVGQSSGELRAVC